MSPDVKRRDFLRVTGAAAIAAAWAPSGAGAQTTSSGTRTPVTLNLAEWTQGYVGLETTQLPRGEVLTGKYISVEVLTPRQPAVR